MSNKKVKEINKVYNRKIERNKLKRKYKTNRISNIWYKLQGKDHYTKIDKKLED